jgi:hypothetical protein
METDSTTLRNITRLAAALAAHHAGCPDEDGKHYYDEAGFCFDCRAEEPAFPKIPVPCVCCDETFTPTAEEADGRWCRRCLAAADHQYAVEHPTQFV